MKYFPVYSFTVLSTSLLVNYYLFHIDIGLPILFLFLVLAFTFKETLGFIFFTAFLVILGFSITPPNIAIKDKEPVSGTCLVTSLPKKYYYNYEFHCFILSASEAKLQRQEILTIGNINPYLLDKLSFLGRIKNSKLYVYRALTKIETPWYLLPIKEFREKLISNYRDNTLDKFAFSIGNSLLFGDKSFLPKDFKEALYNTGLAHLFSISGMHVAILFTFVVVLILRFNRKVAYILASTFTVFYALISGLHFPVVRASGMAVLYSYGKFKNLKVDMLNLLFFVAFMSVLIYPYSLFSISFQLSFMAVLGIILFWRQLKFEISNKIFDYIVKSYLTSLFATFFTAPLLLYFFKKLSLLSLLFTTPLLILLYPYLVLGFLNMTTFFSFTPLVKLFDFLGEILGKIILYIGDIHVLSGSTQLSVYTVVIFYVGAILALLLQFNPILKLSVLICLFLLLTI